MTVRLAGTTPVRTDRQSVHPRRWRARTIAAAIAIAVGSVAAGASLSGAGDAAPKPRPASAAGLSEADGALAGRFARAAAFDDTAAAYADRALQERFGDRRASSTAASLSAADQALRDRFRDR